MFAALPAAEVERQQDRALLVLTVPELRMRMLDQIAGAVQQLGQAVARRVGRRADDHAVRAFAGAVLGTLLAPLLAAGADPRADYLALMEASLAYLEAGLPL